jgi:hypothetical protein
MKTRITLIGMALLLASALCTFAGDKPQAKMGSPEFERMKSLVGTWTGKVDMGNGPVEMTATYTLIAGGSVLEERVFAGTPQEMTTMYYDRNGKLAATHYCVLGNRPQFFLKSSDKDSLTLDFDKSCGIDTKKESHMHTFKIVFNDPNTITTSCVSYVDGKQSPGCETVLKRVK